jgi:Family of unknown function (DUF6448)
VVMDAASEEGEKHDASALRFHGRSGGERCPPGAGQRGCPHHPVVRPAEGEPEVAAAFEQVLPVRAAGGPAAEIAERWFFETVVRVHRAGEGAPYTGLKPAGLGEGPVILVAERAIQTGSPDELRGTLSTIVAEEAKTRLDHVLVLQQQQAGTVAAAREYVQAMLGLQVWAHKAYLALVGGGHG